MKQLLLASISILLLQQTFAQVAISNPASVPDASAMLDVKSTNKGFLMPRVVLRNNVVSPATGLLVYETTSNAVWVYNGSGWVQLGSGAGSSQWVTNGTHIYNGNTGNVGIGINAPTAKLHLTGLMKIDGGQIDIDDNIAKVRLLYNASPKGYFSFTSSSGDIQIGTNVGSNDDGKLQLETKSFPRITILPEGNVGVGLINPSYKLDVNGDVRTQGNLRMEDGYLRMTNTADSKNWQVQYSTSLGGRLLFMQQGLERVIMRNDGNVGIGGTLPLTNNGFPQTKLHIETGQDAGLTSVKNGYLMLGTNSGTNLVMDNNEIIVRDGATGTASLYLQNEGGELISGARLTINKDAEALRIDGTAPVARFYLSGSSKGTIGLNSGGDMVLGTNSGSAMILTPNGASAVLNPSNGGNVVVSPTGGGDIVMTTTTGGNIAMNPNGQVAIGVSVAAASAYKLTVSGKILCEEVKVKLRSAGWPDYVFHRNYKLRPLADLQTFIRQNNHLPNIPSAAQVEKEGIAVGEMNKKLVEKVEELTLYILQMEARIKALEIKTK